MGSDLYSSVFACVGRVLLPMVQVVPSNDLNLQLSVSYYPSMRFRSDGAIFFQKCAASEQLELLSYISLQRNSPI